MQVQGKLGKGFWSGAATAMAKKVSEGWQCSLALCMLALNHGTCDARGVLAALAVLPGTGVALARW